MLFSLKLPDGRDLCDEANQIIVTDNAGSILLLAYTTNSVIVCGHHREPSWAEFLSDAGYSVVERLPQATAGASKLVCRIQAADGRVLALRGTDARVYSANGDPVAAVVWDKFPVCCHCADEAWDAYCTKHNIYKPRELTIVET